ncbi:MAG: hypothetical protein QF510_09245, partial [Rhodospirillales bacterium]|nr:hypothetical protein [Rhodospirillales bacterium]
GINCPQFYCEIGKERIKHILGNVLGVTNFDVNLVYLRPGQGSSQGLRHTKQDKSIYILKDEATLITDEGEKNLPSGTCAGFPFDGMIGHLVSNGSNAMVGHLYADDRTTGDGVEYSDIDLRAEFVPEKGYLFVQKDGTPFQHL